MHGRGDAQRFNRVQGCAQVTSIKCVRGLLAPRRPINVSREPVNKHKRVRGSQYFFRRPRSTPRRKIKPDPNEGRVTVGGGVVWGPP